MPKTIKQHIEKINELEQSIAKSKKDPASLKKLISAFEDLQKLKDGPLSYLDITTTEDMIHLYGVDTEDYFEKLQRSDVALKGRTNPNNYAILPPDIHLVVIKRTVRNEQIANSIVKEIISALKEKY